MALDTALFRTDLARANEDAVEALALVWHNSGIPMSAGAIANVDIYTCFSPGQPGTAQGRATASKDLTNETSRLGGILLEFDHGFEQFNVTSECELPLSRIRRILHARLAKQRGFHRNFWVSGQLANRGRKPGWQRNTTLHKYMRKYMEGLDHTYIRPSHRPGIRQVPDSHEMICQRRPLDACLHCVCLLHWSRIGRPFPC